MTFLTMNSSEILKNLASIEEEKNSAYEKFLKNFDKEDKEELYYDLDLVEKIWEIGDFWNFSVDEIKAKNVGGNCSITMQLFFFMNIVKTYHRYNIYIVPDWDVLFGEIFSIESEIKVIKDNPSLPLSYEGVDENQARIDNLLRTKNRKIEEFHKWREEFGEIFFEASQNKTEYKKGGENTIIALNIPSMVAIKLLETKTDFSRCKVRLEPVFE